MLQKAAEIWGNTVESTIPIVIDAQFANNLFCDANSATLGAAGPTGVGSAGSGVPLPNTWYTVAEFNMLTGTDHQAGAEISMTFNAKLDDNNNCLANTNWYYGLDHNEGDNIDLLATALHEIGHGLGFLNFFDENTGQFCCDPPAVRQKDVYSVFTLDPTVGERWDQMNAAERVISAKNCGNVVWAGQRVMSAAPSFLDLGTPRLLINSPAGIADDYQVGLAVPTSAPLASPGVTAPVQLVNDGSGTTTDGCQSLLGFTPGNIALMD
ncbi:MAG TPA: peptidase, partial [candidate division Zixibacteria bacterium]|nr:peptidase [candidate division Zixibacteria bacterium]